MGIAAVREIFVRAGDGKITCTRARLSNGPDGLILEFKGTHTEDGVAFSVESAGFQAGAENEVARQMALDLITGYVPGDPASDDPPDPQKYLHHQQNPSMTWTINHNLGFRPSVTLLMAGSMEVEADVVHVSKNMISAAFVIPTAGLAVCH